MFLNASPYGGTKTSELWFAFLFDCCFSLCYHKRMAAIEQRLEYHELLMNLDSLENIPQYDLPDGYSYFFLFFINLRIDTTYNS